MGVRECTAIERVECIFLFLLVFASMSTPSVVFPMPNRPTRRHIIVARILLVGRTGLWALAPLMALRLVQRRRAISPRSPDAFIRTPTRATTSTISTGIE